MLREQGLAMQSTTTTSAAATTAAATFLILLLLLFRLQLLRRLLLLMTFPRAQDVSSSRSVSRRIQNSVLSPRLQQPQGQMGASSLSLCSCSCLPHNLAVYPQERHDFVPTPPKKGPLGQGTSPRLSREILHWHQAAGPPLEASSVSRRGGGRGGGGRHIGLCSGGLGACLSLLEIIRRTVTVIMIMRTASLWVADERNTYSATPSLA